MTPEQERELYFLRSRVETLEREAKQRDKWLRDAIRRISLLNGAVTLVGTAVFVGWVFRAVTAKEYVLWEWVALALLAGFLLIMGVRWVVAMDREEP